jgi:hypothetical protein
MYVCMWIGIGRKKEINGKEREDIAQPMMQVTGVPFDHEANRADALR